MSFSGMEISKPLSDEQLQEWMQKHDITAHGINPSIAKATLKGKCMVIK